MEKLRLPIIGMRIKDIRPMTKREQANEGWSSPATVIVLENNTKLYASSDDEGNDAGVIFGVCGQRHFAM